MPVCDCSLQCRQDCSCPLYTTNACSPSIVTHESILRFTIIRADQIPSGIPPKSNPSPHVSSRIDSTSPNAVRNSTIFSSLTSSGRSWTFTSTLPSSNVIRSLYIFPSNSTSCFSSFSSTTFCANSRSLTFTKAHDPPRWHCNLLTSSFFRPSTVLQKPCTFSNDGLMGKAE